jgi:hypothetical protein
MAIWFEIHCDVNSEGPEADRRTRLRPFCQSQRNDQPGGWNRDEVLKIAKKRGWKIGSLHICPDCQKMPEDVALASNQENNHE